MTGAVTAADVKKLREQTGAGMMDAKTALAEAQGDFAVAVDILRRKGVLKAGKKFDREAREGVIEAYIHGDGRIGVLVEVNCETDFVARLPEFQQLCRDLGMQIASQQPETLQVLLEQPFIKDQGQTIGQYVSSLVAKTGENIVVKRFVRFGLGEAR